MPNRCQPIPDKFWAKVQKTPSCWVWVGARFTVGYGALHIVEPSGRKTKLYAHRLAWELENGPIPDGMVVMHKCDNPLCVRVEHLEIGTQADNVRDAVKKKRHARGEKNGHAKLTPRDVRTIRRRVSAGESQASLAREYSVGQMTVSWLVRRITWRHIT